MGLRGARLKKRLALAGVPLMEINLTVGKNYDHYGMIIVTKMIGIFKNNNWKSQNADKKSYEECYFVLLN